ncbi:hypothetical protein PQC07_gp140 [Aeromonas phage D3]|uniref:Uncharacterized protein n=1 Tax=Aeromonas phage D3 TaxID=2593327 RepID=A0A514TVW1_9CAUD|nr:hypothetical protein PQC07_gp140 [Aeromonas phage D3]QDJ97133.1 hypothetical protein D3_0135 [Aeromonas phage D3]
MFNFAQKHDIEKDTLELLGDTDNGSMVVRVSDAGKGTYARTITMELTNQGQTSEGMIENLQLFQNDLETIPLIRRLHHGISLGVYWIGDAELRQDIIHALSEWYHKLNGDLIVDEYIEDSWGEYTPQIEMELEFNRSITFQLGNFDVSVKRTGEEGFIKDVVKVSMANGQASICTSIVKDWGKNPEIPCKELYVSIIEEHFGAFKVEPKGE